MNEKLLPCPFCWSSDHVHYQDDPYQAHRKDGWQVQWDNCSMPCLQWFDSKESAAKARNTRPAPAHAGDGEVDSADRRDVPPCLTLSETLEAMSYLMHHIPGLTKEQADRVVAHVMSEMCPGIGKKRARATSDLGGVEHQCGGPEEACLHIGCKECGTTEESLRRLVNALSDKLDQKEGDLYAADARLKEIEQYRTGHWPTCRGMDEAAGRCDCGYLQGEAYRGLIDRLGEQDAELSKMRAALEAAIGGGDGWVSCSEPPKYRDSVWCATRREGAPAVIEGRHDHHGWWLIHDGCAYSFPECGYEEPTHWQEMKVPTPPQSTDGGKA